MMRTAAANSTTEVDTGGLACVRPAEEGGAIRITTAYLMLMMMLRL